MARTSRVACSGNRLHPLSEPVAVDVNQLALNVVELTRSQQGETVPDTDRCQRRAGAVPAIGEAAPLEALMNLVLNAIVRCPKADGPRSEHGSTAAACAAR
jgi:hypothetical protein